MPDTISAQDLFLAAFDTYLDEAGVAAVARERALERKLSAAKGQITKLRNAAKKEQNHAE